MRQLLGIFLLILIFSTTKAQLTTDPVFPAADQPIIFTIDVSGTSLEGHSGNVYIWTWIAEGCATGCDAPTNVNPATAAQSDALMIQSGADPNIYSITYTPTTFFSKPANEIVTIGLLAKGTDWSDGQTSDFFVDIHTGGLAIQITSPSKEPVFLGSGEILQIAATSSETANLDILINGSIVASETASNSINYSFSSTTEGKYNIVAKATSGTEVFDSTYAIISPATVNEPRPAGVVAGINYFPADPTKVILDLWAPNKSSAYVVGEFSNWEVDPQFKMKKDGEHFWIEIENLEAGREYAYQYLVDETIYLADPFSDKILDPDDRFIPESQYPGLQPYPEQALRDRWYYNRLSVLETGQTPYQWQHDKVNVAVDSLIIYELLIRDFFASGERTYANLVDTLSYFKELGVNTIQLMPVMEFNGNESWGYNPTFMFAPDKYYGPKEDLKAFIDAAHGMDIAVILDFTMNHQDVPNAFLNLYFDFDNFRPTADNPFFNIEARHPFNVFFDMDHESSYTQQYLDTVNYYWLNEYKVDGYRYDLSKGFTQNFTDDVGAWSNYDASRIALLKRMADEIRQYDQDAILILEHFGANNEEVELADYGFLFWGNLNHSYSQAAMGFADGSSLDWGYYGTRGFNDPHLVTYMESHDEERVAYRLKDFGNQNSSYSTRTLENRLERVKAAAAFFYTVPGPKMLWQWGEWGYDVSIEEGGRLAIKPIPWNNVDGLSYNTDPLRIKTFKFHKAILNLRQEYPLFSFGEATFSGGNSLLKQITVRNNPYTDSPSTPEEMNAVIVGNFDIVSRDVTVNFPHSGMWYNYFASSSSLEVTGTQTSLTMAPGEFRIFTDVALPEPTPEVTRFDDPMSPEILSLEEVANEGIRITWADNSAIESGHRVLRSTDNENFEPLGTLAANTTGFLDTEAEAGITYYYKVQAFNTYGSSLSEASEISATDIITSVTGFDDSIRFYPNPVNNILNLTVPESYDLNVYDLRGQRMLTSSGEGGETSIQLTGLPSGLYQIEVITDSERKVFKVVKE